MQEQISRIDNKNYSLEGNYKHPLGKKNFMDVNYTQRNYNADRIKDFFDVDPLNRTLKDFNEILSSSFNNDIEYNRFGLGWTKNHKKYTTISQLVYQKSFLSGGLSADDKLGLSYNYLLPNFSLNITKPNIRLRYNTSINEPTIDQLQPIVDNSNPLNVYVGNPDLVPEYNHSVNLRYFFFDRFNFRHFYTSLDFRHTENDIVNSQIVDANYKRSTMPINVKSNERISGRLGFGTPIKPLKIKTRIGAGLNFTNGINYVNGIENKVKTTSPNLSLELENLNNEKATVIVYSRFNYSKNKYSANSELDGGFLNQSYGSSLFVELGKGFGFDSSVDFNIYSKERYGDDNKITIWNANASKRVMKNRLTFKLTAFDILNLNRGISRNAGDTYLEEVVTNSIGRYFMFSALYRLTSFNPENSGGSRYRGRGGRR